MPPVPLVVSPAEVATGGARAVSLEGVLIEVQAVTVQEQNPPAGPGDEDPTHEFVVDGGLRVDDYIYRYPLPEVGASFQRITGVLRLGNADYKLIPRAAGDLTQ